MRVSVFHTNVERQISKVLLICLSPTCGGKIRQGGVAPRVEQILVFANFLAKAQLDGESRYSPLFSTSGECPPVRQIPSPRYHRIHTTLCI